MTSVGPTDSAETPQVAETGLTRSRRAVAEAAGWPWCDEHKRPRWDSSDPCNHLHPQPSTVTYDEDGAPEPPPGGQYR